MTHSHQKGGGGLELGHARSAHSAPGIRGNVHGLQPGQRHRCATCMPKEEMVGSPKRGDFKRKPKKPGGFPK